MRLRTLCVAVRVRGSQRRAFRRGDEDEDDEGSDADAESAGAEEEDADTCAVGCVSMLALLGCVVLLKRRK